MLEAGDYTLLLSTDADSVCPVARVRLDQSVITEQCERCCAPEMGMLVRGTGGRTATCLREKGIPNIVVSDGPAGLNIVNTVKIADDGMEYALKTSERWNVGAYADQVKKMRMMALKKPGVVAYRYVTAWPTHILLAQTWNTDLVREVGDAMGAELVAYRKCLRAVSFQRGSSCKYVSRAG